MAISYADLVRINSLTVGFGPLTLDGTDQGFLDFAGAGVTPGSVISYTLLDRTNGNREIGRGVYDGMTLSRTPLLTSVGGAAPLNLNGATLVTVPPIAADFNEIWAAINNSLTIQNLLTYIAGLPTDDAGLPSGSLWLNGNLLAFVP